MQKFLSITLLLLFPVLLHAQSGRKPQHNVTKFLGIPVDGSKWTMIQKLKEKGFVEPNNKFDLEGEFNGENVYVKIVTNNNKVWRIGVWDKTTRSEAQIKIRYNKLIRQFRNSVKYKELRVKKISENENLSFDTNGDDLKYSSSFMQAPLDIEMTKRYVLFKIFKESYGQYRIYIFYENGFNQFL